MKQFLLSLLCLVALALLVSEVPAFGHHNQSVFKQRTVIKGVAGAPVVPGNTIVNRSYYVHQTPVVVQQTPLLLQRSFVPTTTYVQQAPVLVQQAQPIVRQAPVYTQEVQRSFLHQQYAQPQLAPAIVQQAPVYTQQVAADVQCQTCSTPAASFGLAPSYATGGCATGVGAAFSPGFGTVPTYPTVGVGASFAPGYGTLPTGHGVFRQRTVQRY
jgi:hypothetical protein